RARRLPGAHGGGAGERRAGHAADRQPGPRGRGRCGGPGRPAVKREPLFWRGSAALVLASASPRRVTLLRQAGAVFTVVDPGPDRDWPGEVDARHGVRALALEKARRVARRRPGRVVIGADTVVVLRGRRLGKPRDAAQAEAMLQRLHGRT